MSEGSPSAFDMLKSVILPGKDTIQDYALSSWEEAKETDWLKTGYQIEGVSLLLFVFAAIAGSVLLFDYRTLLLDSIKIAGLHIIILAILILLLILFRVVLLAVGAVNEGDSVIRLLTRDRGPVSSYRFIVGLASLVLSIAVVSKSSVSWAQLVIFGVTVLLILGSLGFAVSGAISMVVAYKS